MANPNVPQMGLQYLILGEREAIATLKRIEQVLRQQEAQMDRMATATERSARRQTNAHRQTAAASTKSTQSILKNLRSLRWQIITVMFFAKQAGKVISGMFNQIAESAESAASRQGIQAMAAGYDASIKSIIENLQAVSHETLSTMDAFTLAQKGLTTDLGEFAENYDEYWQSARLVQRATGEEAESVYVAIAEAIAKADAEILDNATTIYQARQAVQDYADAQGVLVDELSDATKQAIIFNRVQEVTNTLIANGADNTLTATDELNALKATWKDVTDAFGATISTQLSVSTGLETINELLKKAGVLWVIVASRVAAANALMKGFSFEAAKEAGRIVREAGFEALGRVEDRPGAGLPLPGELYDEDKDKSARERNIDSLLRHIERREEIIDKHNERLRQMYESYQDDIEKIEVRTTRDIARTQRDAERDRQKAVRKNARKVEELTRDHYRTLEYELRKHTLDTKHRNERFRQESIQDERMYQYERSILVAEGDVLAIEDLDARYRLEQQARGKNQRLTLAQEEEQYQQKRQKRVADFQTDLSDLQWQLDERIKEIAQAERDRIAELRARRVEDLAEAKRNYEEQRAAEVENQAVRLQQWAEHWEAVARQTKIGVDKMMTIIRSVYGPGGEAEEIISQFHTRVVQMMARVTDIERILGERVTASVPWRGQIGRRMTGRPRQFGGNEWFSRPTLLRVGEGQAPEHVVTSPGYGRGGSMTLAWQGGPIPLHGSGSLAGADLSGLGNTLAQGIVISLREGLVG